MNVSFKKYLSDMNFYLKVKPVQNLFHAMFPCSTRTKQDVNKRIKDFILWEAEKLDIETQLETTDFDNRTEYERSFLCLSKGSLLTYFNSIYNDDYPEDLEKIAILYAEVMIDKYFPNTNDEDLLDTRTARMEDLTVSKGKELMNMKNFTIDFAGSCVIAAEDENAALRTFWELINNQQPLPMNLYEVQNVEEET